MKKKSSRQKAVITAVAGCLLAVMLAITDSKGGKADYVERAKPEQVLRKQNIF